MGRYGIRVALALTLALAACGGSAGNDGGPDGTGAAPSVSPSPSPTPTLPSAAADKKLAKAALLTAAELGKPWIEPKAVNTAKGTKGEACPGQKNSLKLNPARADASRDMTEGKQQGAAIGSFGIRAYGFGNEQKWRDSFAATAKGCASWKAAEGTFVTLDVVTPPAVEGADEVLAHIERIYADKTKKKLYYVRHWYEARTGRVVTAFEYAYIQPKSDPTGKDMAKSAKLLAKQVAKTVKTFDL